MSRSRNYCFTLNNYSSDDEIWCYNLAWLEDTRYVCVGKEVGESGTPHLQGMVCFTTLKSLSQLKQIHESAHWEIMKGTPAQAAEYCRKDGDFYEYGDCPQLNSEQGIAEKERWAHALLCVQEGRLSDIPADILCRNLRQIEYAAQKLVAPPSILQGELEHEWWFGSPGTGKTRLAFETYPNAFFKDPKERWWDGYAGQDVVVIDDFDKYQVAQGGDVKRWLDRYPFQAPVKGGYLCIRPRKIIVTSNYHPDLIWDDAITQAAISRRVDIRNFDGPYTKYAPLFNPVN